MDIDLKKQKNVTELWPVGGLIKGLVVQSGPLRGSNHFLH